jgi:hypothetical protein
LLHGARHYHRSWQDVNAVRYTNAAFGKDGRELLKLGSSNLKCISDCRTCISDWTVGIEAVCDRPAV